MKLYDTPLAPNPRRVRWLMAEKGVDDIEIVQVSLLEGQHRTPEYVRKTGAAVAPALELDDGTTITESLAICRYLESRYPEPNLFGRTPEETAVIEMWTRRAEILLALPLMMTVRLTHPALAVLETPNPAVAEYNRERSLQALARLDEHLAGSEWLAGPRFTIADIVAFVGIDFGRLIRLQIPGELGHARRWAAAMRERPGAKAA